MRSKLERGVCALMIGLAVGGPAGAAERADRVERLEREVAELRAALAELKEAGTATARLDELERRLEVLAEEVEDLRVGEAAFADRAERGLGPAASKVYRSRGGVSIGGYGEALYTAYDDTRDDGAPSGKDTTFDLLRNVIYLGYKFDDRFVLNTEIEVEHANTEENGEVEVEFAYVDWMLRPELNLRAGMVLVPMGFVNELHEPTTFLGATRPELTRRIVPTTWAENGFGLYGDLGPFSYRTYLVTGLDAAGFSAQGIRGGRQKGSKAKADDLAWVGRLDFTGVPGLTLGGSLYVGGADQGRTGSDGRSLDTSVTIAELHGEWRWRGLELRAVGAWASLDGVEELNAALGLAGGEGVAEGMNGWYLQAGYDLLAARGGRSALIPYVRWERLDTQADPAPGFAADPANDLEIVTFGVAYRPIEQVILKLDWQNWENGAGTGVDRFNLALGYIF